MEVSQIDVITGAQAALPVADSSDITSRSRKVSRSDLKLSSSCIELQNGRLVLNSPENSVSDRSLTGGASSTVDLCPSECSDCFSSSCCSSNETNEPVDGKIEFVDLQDEDGGEETSTHYCCRRSRETTPESEEMESIVKPFESDSRRNLVEEKMPTESELEEFFADAEKGLLKVFTGKYNFDFANEKPLEGRYEWIAIQEKPEEEDNNNGGR